MTSSRGPMLRNLPDKALSRAFLSVFDSFATCPSLRASALGIADLTSGETNANGGGSTPSFNENLSMARHVPTNPGYTAVGLRAWVAEHGTPAAKTPLDLHRQQEENDNA